MASAKDIRKRITSVKNTQQITRAMKMVSAAKLRRAQESIFALRPYAHGINDIVLSLLKGLDPDYSHPLLLTREKTDKPNLLLVVVTSDRGLCGALNGSTIKTAQRLLNANSEKYAKTDVAFIGKKGYEFFKTKKTGIQYFQNVFQNLKIAKAKAIANELIQLFCSEQYDEISFIYNEFKSALSQKVCIEKFLPVSPLDLPTTPENIQSLPITIYEPSASEILDQLLPQHFAVQVYRILRESLASEHAARMTAMENATRNAGEMIKKLTLVYNKTRQAGITKELLEITSGSEAQKA